MGAIFRTITFDNMDEKKLRKEYEEFREEDFAEYCMNMQDDWGDDEWEYDGYSGTFMEAHDLTYIKKHGKSNPFKNYEQAEKFLMDWCCKWGSAQAVCYKAYRKKRWMIGAWLSC